MGWKGKWGVELQDLKIEKLKDLGLIKPKRMKEFNRKILLPLRKMDLL